MRPGRPPHTTIERSPAPAGAPRFPVDDTRWSGRSLAAGLLGTLLFHLLFVFGVPTTLLDLGSTEPETGSSELEFDLAPPEEDEQPEPEPRFVETNREAPDNIPDDTADFSARNQQAANPEPPKELSADQTPAREGETDVPDDRIFAGSLEPVVDTTPAPEQTSPQSEPLPPSRPERRDPLPGFEEDETRAEEGAGSSLATRASDPTPVRERVEGTDVESPDTQLPVFTSPLSADRPAPAPRPRLPRALPGPVKAQPVGVSQTGSIGVNARFSQYGEYLERLVEAVSQRWHALCESRSYSERSARVVIEFRITREGLIRGMETVDSTSQALGVLLCRSAIEGGQPYGAWPQDMVDVLGEEQTVTFAFHYW